MITDKPTIYLAGPIQHVADSGHGWRDDLIAEYSDRFDFLNPLDKYDADEIENEAVRWLESNITKP